MRKRREGLGECWKIKTGWKKERERERKSIYQSHIYSINIHKYMFTFLFIHNNEDGAHHVQNNIPDVYNTENKICLFFWPSTKLQNIIYRHTHTHKLVNIIMYKYTGAHKYKMHFQSLLTFSTQNTKSKRKVKLPRWNRLIKNNLLRYWSIEQKGTSSK